MAVEIELDSDGLCWFCREGAVCALSRSVSVIAVNSGRGGVAAQAGICQRCTRQLAQFWIERTGRASGARLESLFKDESS